MGTQPSYHHGCELWKLQKEGKLATTTCTFTQVRVFNRVNNA